MSMQRGELTRISKAMSYFLRHSPLAKNDPSGWVEVPELQANLMERTTLAQIREVVEHNNKKRFVLDESVDPPRIRAAQGHSVQLEAPILQEVLDIDSVPFAVHVTSKKSWEEIQSAGALDKMRRTHIHFATLGSHMRSNSWANTLLRLKTQEAMEAGHKFYLSDNSVLLTEGPLPIEFVEHIDPSDIPADWRQ
ncbi:hypothetical protein BSKO_08671 [Bryopsis sp. KO-2023]|nr:hypothetical protein BSKO_08671 [Bryopsis sp. KO-2023]